MIALLLATLALAEPLDGPSFEGRGVGPAAAISEAMIADFSAVLGLRAPDGLPLTITAVPRAPSLRLVESLAPPEIGEGPPSAERDFLLELSALVPAERLDAKTAARIADARFAQARAVWPDLAAASRWMAATLPALRVAATAPARRPDRLALRAAWAARLAGDQDDLAWVAGLLQGAPDTAEAAEAWLVLADAWMQPRTWDNQAALAAAEASASSRAAPLGAGYALGWAWYDVGENGRAMETLRALVLRATRSWPADQGLAHAALNDLMWMFADAGELDLWSGCGPRGVSREAQAILYQTYALDSLEQGRVQVALRALRALAAQGELRDQKLDALVQAANLSDPAARLEVLARLLPTLEAAPGFEQRRAALSVTLVQAAAELHYRRLGTPDLDRDTLVWAYSEGLRLDPRAPHIEAINRLLASL